MCRIFAVTALLMVSLAGASSSHADRIAVVAAENVYGDIVRQIGGPDVDITSILNNPDQDPHAFEASTSIARRIAEARIVIYNGAGYDEWMSKLLSASTASSRALIEVAKLIGRGSGDNPHFWYRVEAISALAKVSARLLAKIDPAPAHSEDYRRRLASFELAMRPLTARIEHLRLKYAGTSVTATEPVFGYMADALGLDMRNARFQLSVMNGGEPSAQDVADFEHDLRNRHVKVLIFNRQTTGALPARMLAIATESGVPTVAVNETMPADQTYQEWMLTQLDSLERALAVP